MGVSYLWTRTVLEVVDVLILVCCRWKNGFNDSVQAGGCFKDKQLHELIKRDVDRSIAVANVKAKKLHQATTDHIGLELMHLFVLDLLGHDTNAAKIFIHKVRFQ
jgi:hypothetical protein